MARRSSARLRSRNSSTPKRVSLSHDATTAHTPRTVPTKLTSVEEHDEMPGAFPRSLSPPADGTPTRPAKRLATRVAVTPKDVTPVKPSDEEMHPQKHHNTTAKVLDEARHLGFMHMAPHTAPPKQQHSRIATLQATPSRTNVQSANEAQTPTFQFTFRREHSLELSPEAKQLMEEKREEAARIRQQMLAGKEAAEKDVEASDRKIAAAKGKKGRFSEAHNAEFEKMDSIASHASALRATAAPATTIPTPKPQLSRGGAVTKSLKRSPSKARLDEPISKVSTAAQQSPSKAALIPSTSGLPRPASSHILTSGTDTEPSSPSKRHKRTAVDDYVSAARQHSSEDKEPDPATPKQPQALHCQRSNPHVSTVTTPTQALLSRAVSVKSTSKIPASALVASPPKPSTPATQKLKEVDSSVPLLARSPSKATLFAEANVEKATTDQAPFFRWSPLKPSPRKQQAELTDESLASRSSETPLLARLPLKSSTAKSVNVDAESEQQPSVLLLARSPSKIALPTNPTTTQVSTSPGKSLGMGIMGRFNLLRASPMKSILRSPHRLYSDDPAKVAAGTHFATPPKSKVIESTVHDSHAVTTATGHKRVDFTSSTKERWEAGQKAQQEASSTPSKTPSPSPADSAKIADKDKMQVNYPSLPNSLDPVSPSPQKRRQTIAPGEFTFRADDHGVVFGPGAPSELAKGKRPSTIRHVSSDFVNLTSQPVQGSKKRKFEFENEEAAVQSATAIPEVGKENAEPVGTSTEVEERPTKRTKANPAEPTPSPTKSSVARRTTLGVKPKGAKTLAPPKDKKPATISQARLNALAMPKKRG
ncbi:hypothetical protein BAUCODRAFT_170609 [Baudoinia panamericana UAMH 10762]|uniref:Erythromycin esterase n=1 Tax=Baudoinia panamericana (strain UAMH 10762) TaxID=717646 RepID=M2N8L7_BAUPA|nr:uncharacterized protein BAUCODRAFT_170609 [Baudoinia panamericana UAMH 10762]EMD00484.1 hypothetical protein BAUCODRAFT_170609 [Baudoinia panamericana UAMH 10762]